MFALHRSLLLSLALSFFAIAASPAVPPPTSVPVWTFSVPPPETTSTSSAVSSITSDSAGNAFIVVNLTNTTMVGGLPVSTPAGVQLFLLSSKGKLIGKTESDDINVSPLLVSPKRVVAVVDGNLVEYVPNRSEILESLPLSVEDERNGETVVPGTPANLTIKWIHTTQPDPNHANFIGPIKRYLITKLKIAPVQ